MLSAALQNKWPVYAYARVSTREQNGPNHVSLASQLLAINEWCQAKKLTVQNQITEMHSAFKPLISSKAPLHRLAYVPFSLLFSHGLSMRIDIVFVSYGLQ